MSGGTPFCATHSCWMASKRHAARSATWLGNGCVVKRFDETYRPVPLSWRVLTYPMQKVFTFGAPKTTTATARAACAASISTFFLCSMHCFLAARALASISSAFKISASSVDINSMAGFSSPCVSVVFS